METAMDDEHPHWPALELRRVANGWIVQRGSYQGQDRTFSYLEDVYCFSQWRDCEQFMAKVTTSSSVEAE